LSQDLADSHLIHIKIADFGLAKNLILSDIYQISSRNPLPIKWMAPESFIDFKFSSKTDVWSFGLIIIEIFNKGKNPYPGKY